MDQHYSSIKAPTVGTAPSASNAGVSWTNPSRITANDGSSAGLTYTAGGDRGATIRGSSFGFQQLPANAVIDGIQLNLNGVNIGCYGTITISPAGTTGKDIGTLSGAYGGPKDKWGATTITPSDIANISVTIDTGDVSGGDGIASLDYMTLQVFWHIELTGAAANVPTRVEYKMYSKDRKFLGLIPNVTSKFAFSQDMGAAGSTIQVTCGQQIENVLSVDAILDDTGAAVQDENNLPILGITGTTVIAAGSSGDDAMFKNGNRLQVWIYDYWHPNGKLMFSGQVNRVKYKPGGNNAVLTVHSDGLDLDQYIARGYPFALTQDVSQPNSNDSKTVQDFGGKGGGWVRWGQTFKTGVGVTNVAAILIRLNGSADVTVRLFDAPNGNLLGSVTITGLVTSGWYGWQDIRFDFPQLINVTGAKTYFFDVQVGQGQSILIATSPSDVYVDGSMYLSSYAGGSGGGNYADYGNDIYFNTYYGTPTTTTTYAAQDPITGMMSKILLDYNNRGGFITQRTFVAAGLILTRVFNSASIFDALKIVLEMSPQGYYPYIDLGTAEMDILQQSNTADFTVTNKKQVADLEIDMSIEQVKNYFLFSGGDVGGGVNLFRQYSDTKSSANFGPRMATKSDNRVTQTATADAIGTSFIAENSGETQETQLIVWNSQMDITKLIPGKTIGFKSYDSFIASLVLQIARRDYQPEFVVLTLGRLPVRLSDEVQRINRELLLEQTIDNPVAPS